MPRATAARRPARYRDVKGGDDGERAGQQRSDEFDPGLHFAARPAHRERIGMGEQKDRDETEQGQARQRRERSHQRCSQSLHRRRVGAEIVDQCVGFPVDHSN